MSDRRRHPRSRPAGPKPRASRPARAPGLEYLGPDKKAAADDFDAGGGLEIDFEDVVARVFPLRANFNRLRSFCDRYLNVDIPPKMAHFTPAAPYVFLMVLNYGRMSEVASNLGWASQNEVLFGVPLFGQWSDERGRMVRDFNFVAPFIFVDNFHCRSESQHFGSSADDHRSCESDIDYCIGAQFAGVIDHPIERLFPAFGQ